MPFTDQSKDLTDSDEGQLYSQLILSLLKGRFDLVHAFILAKVESGKDGEVLEEVKKSAGVQSATPTYGEYDLHVEVSFENKEELDAFIFEKIRRVTGIKEALTLIAFSRYEKSNQ